MGVTRVDGKLSGCGIRVAASSNSSTRQAVDEARSALGDSGDFQHIVAFFGIDRPTMDSDVRRLTADTASQLPH